MNVFYRFDETGDLELVPLAARRALDAAGAKLSRDGWRSLSRASRLALATEGAQQRVDLASVLELVANATPPPEPIPRVAEPPMDAPPGVVRDALGASRPLAPEVWRAISALDRYVLVKVCAKGRTDRIDAAWEEIVAPRIRPGGG